MPDFVNSKNEIDPQWNDFESDVGMLLFYFAISDDKLAASGDCRRYVSSR
jgi:hypothetical protein